MPVGLIAAMASSWSSVCRRRPHDGAAERRNADSS